MHQDNISNLESAAQYIYLHSADKTHHKSFIVNVFIPYLTSTHYPTTKTGLEVPSGINSVSIFKNNFVFDFYKVSATSNRKASGLKKKKKKENEGEISTFLCKQKLMECVSSKAAYKKY